MPRRGENIRKRIDGRWEARYIRSYDTAGKARYGYLYAKTYAEVKRKKAEAQTGKPERANGCQKPKCMDDIMAAWLERKAGSVKQSSYCQYAAMIENHLSPALGGLKPTAVSSDVIEQYVQNKRKAGRLDGMGGLSPKTIADQIIVLNQVIAFSVRRGWMPVESFSFPMPTYGRFQPKLLNELDWGRLNRLVRTPQTTPMLGVLIAMHTGLRIGEICALRFSDIDWEAGALSVNHTVLRMKNIDVTTKSKTRIVIDAPKTDSSRRRIPLPAFLLPILKRGLQQASSQFAFINTGTETCTEPRIFYRQYQSIQKQCGIDGYTFHALRHTFATRCIENGCDPKTLSELLGHASVKLTLERYVHPTMHAKRAAMERLASMDSWSENVVVMG